MKKKLLIIGGIIIFAVISKVVTDPLMTNKSFQAGMQKAVQENVKTNPSITSTEDTERKAIEKAVKSVVDDKHIKEISVAPVEPSYALEGGKYNVTIALYVDDSGDMAATAVKLKTTEVFASLFLKDLGVNEAWTMAWYPYRGTNTGMVLKSRLNRDIAQKATHNSKMSFQYDAERLMIIEKWSYTELPVSDTTSTTNSRNLQGTEAEKEIFNYAMNLYDKYSATLDSYEAETRSTKETSDHFSITTGEVEKIIYKLQ